MIDPAKYYSELLRTITDADVYRAAKVMMYHIGKDNAIDLLDLAEQVFGNKSVSSERRSRRCLELLVKEYNMPIGASSGKAGRWLCATPDEISETVSDLISRRNEIDGRIKALNNAVLPARLPEQTQQIGLWG